MPANLDVEARLRERLATQYGLVTTAQALDAGLSRKALRHRVDTERLVRCHRGIYGDPVVPQSWERRVMAAVLASGENAFASHATALRLWGLTAYPVPDDAPIEVTTILERDPEIPGVVSHRSGLLLERDIRDVRGIPTCSPERTFLDVSGRCSVPNLGRLVDDALRMGITFLHRILDCLERLPRAPGRSPATVREVLASRAVDFEPSESLLEQFVLDAIRGHGLPSPRAQVWIELPSGPRRLDHCYERGRLVIESDGFGPHSTRTAFDDDRRRSNELVLAGYRILHFTTDFTDWEIASTVAEALGIPVPNASEGPKLFKQWIEARPAVRSSGIASGGRSGR